MASIAPIPNSRIPGLLARQRLTQQYQADQLDLFRLQEQISTGLRLTLPSEDAPAALRAISFQRLLDRKEQLGANINSGLLFLGNTDGTLGGTDGVANALSKIKADTLGVVGTVATDQQRQTAISDINGALERLVALANRQFNGRYLFAGSQTDLQPYTFADGNVTYHGDDREIENFQDLGVLFSSSISGQEVFGGISAAVEGQVDLNPPVSADTLLSSLRSGRGIDPNGSLLIADATNNSSSIVDLSSATTIGDVVKLIEDNPPGGAQIRATVTSNGIQVDLVSGGTLVISEVGAGTTARELGLLNDQTPAVPGTVTSEDLDPRLLNTTRLEDLLGNKARATLESVGNNNDILLEASANGTALDGVAVSFVDGGSGSPVSASFDSLAKTLVITIDDGATTAQEVIDAINTDGNFTASSDQGDSSSSTEAGLGIVEVSAIATTTGGSGTTLDQSSGIRVVNGGTTFDITFDGDETVEDLLNRLNRSEAGLHAEINDAGTGINIRSRQSGNDFQIGEIGGTTASQLGIRTFTTNSRLSDFNFGVGVPTKEAVNQNITSADIVFSTSDGSQFAVDLSTATDVLSAIGLINGDPDNTGLITAIQATDDEGNLINAIELVDNTVGTEQLTYTESGSPIAALPNGLDLTIPSQDIIVTDKNGASFAVDLSSAVTVGDVLDLIKQPCRQRRWRRQSADRRSACHQRQRYRASGSNWRTW